MISVTKPAIRRRQATSPRPVERWKDNPRVDIQEKVTGRAEYLEDLPELGGMVYAAPLRSPYCHARVVGIDSTRAERLPGVLAVLHRERLGEFGVAVGRQPPELPLVVTDKARFDGDLVAMVAATDQRTARQATQLIEVRYEPLQPVFSFDEAIAPGAPLVHEELGSNLAVTDSFQWGDVEWGFRLADQVLEEAFFSPNVYHHPMEPTSACVALFANDTIDLWASTNHPFNAAAQAQRLFGVDPDRVRVRVPYVGGGFGGKNVTRDMMAALALSRKTGRPVKLLLTAGESFCFNARHAALYKARVGVKNDGTLVALDVELEVDSGAYSTAARPVTRNMCISAWGCYRIPHFRARARTAYTNKVPASWFRNSGKTQTVYGVECTMDAVARRLGMGPMAFRSKNVLLRGEYPAETWKAGGQEYPADTPPIDTDFPELMRRAAQGISWDGRAGRRDEGPLPRVVRGRGMALSLRHGAQGGGRAYAMVTLGADGILKVSHNAAELGMGTHNVLSVVAARTLEMPEERVKVGIPDTSNNIPFFGTSAQRTTVQMGNAVQAACEHLKRDLISTAAQVKGGTPEEWRVAEGRLWRGEERYEFTDIVGAFEGGVILKGIGAYSYAPSVDKAFGGLDHWSPGGAAAEVEVDTETGEVRLLQYCAVADAGKVIHERSARGQIEGGAVLGLGLALFEELVYQDGQLQNADAFQYRLPSMRDIPQRFTSDIVENGDGPGPFGAKGLAQPSIGCVAPAIGNAICDALGVHVRATPFTPERVLRALGKLG